METKACPNLNRSWRGWKRHVDKLLERHVQNYGLAAGLFRGNSTLGKLRSLFRLFLLVCLLNYHISLDKHRTALARRTFS